MASLECVECGAPLLQGGEALEGALCGRCAGEAMEEGRDESDYDAPYQSDISSVDYH